MWTLTNDDNAFANSTGQTPLRPSDTIIFEFTNSGIDGNDLMVSLFINDHQMTISGCND